MTRTMGMISIGEELLDGRTQEKNAAFLIHWAAGRSFSLRGTWIVGDEFRPIVDALEAASRQFDLVIVSGGLGPTADDMTREAAARWLDVPLFMEESLAKGLEKYLKSHGRPFTENNRRQCIFPEGARILSTEVGTAAGFAVEKNDCQVVFFPGVPREFRWFVHTHLSELVPLPKQAPSFRERLTFFDIGESQLEDRLDGIEALAA